jgi:hypothetical protein
MKPVLFAVAACAIVTVSACGSSSSSTTDGEGTDDKCEADSTFALVQQQIFDNRGCTASACHGQSATGGLDLRAESSYANLINVEASSGDYMRVFPGEQDLSLLYQKVAAKTEGFELGSLPEPISGGAMPTGPDVLTETDLALLRSWIRGGAPETGVVAGSEQYADCSLDGEVAPNKIQPLPAPDAEEGVQFYSGGWTVPAEQEGEVCFVSYYDYSDSIPADFRVPCGDAEGGPERECFVYNRALLAQDPQSHHSIIEFYVPPADEPEQYDPMGPFWENWVCNGGENGGSPCTPGGDECGERSQCVTEPVTSVACIGYPNGPPEMGTIGGLFGTASTRQNLATAQESSFRETYPEGVYALAPLEGFIIWDSHAFNLTKSDTSIEQWMNLSFADPNDLRYRRTQIFDADDIFGMGEIEAFSSAEACGSFTIPQYGRMLNLSTHTHRFGKQFRVWYPPNEPCSGRAPDNDCEPPSTEPDYISFDYEDPLYQRFSEDSGMRFDSEDPAERTFRYCSLWDNGEANPAEVRRNSIKPDAETCDFVGTFAPLANARGFNLFPCGCEPEQRSCFGGPNEGMLCGGDDSVCGEGGVCDACPLGGGVTTEEEMFILLGAYYIETPGL